MSDIAIEPVKQYSSMLTNHTAFIDMYPGENPRHRSDPDKKILNIHMKQTFPCF